MRPLLITFVIISILPAAAESQQKKTAEDYYISGTLKAAKKDYQGAVKEFTKAIARDREYPEAYNNRGSAKMMLEDYPGALEDFTKAIKVYPSFAMAYYNRALVYLKMREKKKALADLMKAKESGYTVPQRTIDLCQ